MLRRGDLWRTGEDVRVDLDLPARTRLLMPATWPGPGFCACCHLAGSAGQRVAWQSGPGSPRKHPKRPAAHHRTLPAQNAIGPGTRLSTRARTVAIALMQPCVAATTTSERALLTSLARAAQISRKCRCEDGLLTSGFRPGLALVVRLPGKCLRPGEMGFGESPVRPGRRHFLSEA